MDVDFIVPVVLFLSIAAVVGLSFYFRFRTRQELQATIRIALERGESLTPELIERMSSNLNPPDADLRRGLLSLSVGVSFVLFALLLGQSEAIRPIAAIGIFPVTIGLAQLGIWYYRKRLADSDG